MARKLKHLKITKVDFVDEGANPDADIMLFKRKQEEPAPAVRSEEEDSFFKRLTGSLRSAFGIADPDEKDPVMKEAKTFSEEYGMRNLDKVTDDMWNVCFALNSSLCSILFDEDMDSAQKQTAMTESLGEFTETVKGALSSWASGDSVGIKARTDDVTAEMSKRLAKPLEVTRDRLSEIIEKSTEGSEGGPTTIIPSKGEVIDMNIDKSKMTPAERAMLEEFEKRYGTEEAPASGNPQPQQPEGGVAKQNPTVQPAPQPAAPAAPAPTPAPAGDDLYKGLSPEVKAELESLKKFKENAEDAELHAIAKGYELIGKSEAELFPLLKALKQTSQEAYDNMISTLDSAKATVEKSGVFDEIGKTGNGAKQGGAVKEAETKAAELMKSKNGLTFAQAVDEVLQADPDLAKRYEMED